MILKVSFELDSFNDSKEEVEEIIKEEMEYNGWEVKDIEIDEKEND